MLFLISVGILFGMWMERYVLITTNLARTYLPSKWGVFIPTIWDFATFAGTLGLFFTMMFLFLRLLPVVSNFEMRELILKKQAPPRGAAGRTAGTATAPPPPATHAGEEVTP